MVDIVSCGFNSKMRFAVCRARWISPRAASTAAFTSENPESDRVSGKQVRVVSCTFLGHPHILHRFGDFPVAINHPSLDRPYDVAAADPYHCRDKIRIKLKRLLKQLNCVFRRVTGPSLPRGHTTKIPVIGFQVLGWLSGCSVDFGSFDFRGNDANNAGRYSIL